MLYDVSDYERNQWRYQRRTHYEHDSLVTAGERIYQGFEQFTEEVFHKFVAPHPRQIENPAPGQEVFQRLHAAMDAVPEVQDLREQCVNDEDWAGNATNTMISTLLEHCDHDGKQVPDVEAEREGLRAMEDFLDRQLEIGDQETIEKIEEEIRTIRKRIDEDIQIVQAAAAMLDGTDIRQIMRAGAKAAKQQIDEQINANEGFPTVGDEQHSGKRAQRAASAEIAKILKDNKRMAEIVEKAGRLRRMALDEQRRKPRRGVDEYCGIELGAELERLVPSEWMMADDPDLEPLFLRRMNERGLTQFEITERKKEQQGPIVFLLDSSGSMSSGGKDYWAAAVCLSFFQIAILQKRSFAVVHFGEDVLRIDYFPASNSLNRNALADAVTFFASDGGTNFQRPIDKAIQIISEEEHFKRADIVMCTDGKASINPGWKMQYHDQKVRMKFSFYSILIGDDTQSSINECFSDEVICLKNILDDDTAVRKFFRAV